MEGHILAAFLQHFAFTSLSDAHGLEFLKDSFSKQAMFQQMVVEVLREHVHLGTRVQSHPHSDSATDGVLSYAKEVLSLLLLWAEFEDAIKEGDGHRLIRCWKFLLPIFKVTNHKNYSIGAVNLLIHCNFLLSPRHREQLLWSRFINTSGKPGGNIACDFHLEHMNRTVKAAIGGLGSNITPKAITRIGKCAGPLMNACNQFDATSAVVQPSGKHGGASWAKDVTKITEQLQQVKAFQNVPGRKHASFPEVKQNLASKLNMEKFKTWFKAQLRELSL